MSLELVHCFLCKQTYQTEVEYDKETGILLPHLDSPLECPNKDCPSQFHESENNFKSNSAAQSKRPAAD